MKKTYIAALLVLLLILSLCACGREGGGEVPPAPESPGDDAQSGGEEETPPTEHGPTAEELKSGDASYAVIPTNTAAQLYNETDGAVQLAAIVRYASANGDPEIKEALGATEAWLSSRGGTKYPAWCIAVRSDIDENVLRDVLADAEKDAEASGDPDAVFISGQFNLLDSVTAFLQSLYYMDPASIGGSMPDDAFYR